MHYFGSELRNLGVFLYSLDKLLCISRSLLGLLNCCIELLG